MTVLRNDQELAGVVVFRNDQEFAGEDISRIYEVNGMQRTKRLPFTTHRKTRKNTGTA